jgi:hypothetical protein
MGTGGTDLSSIFGGSSLGGLASLFGGGATAASPSPDAGWGIPVSGGGVPAYDPTGSYDATAAITGNTASLGPTGPPDLGGQQSGTPPTTQGTPQPPPPPPPAPPGWPAPQAPQAVSQGPFSPAQQPTVPGPTGFTVPTYGGNVPGWPNYNQPGAPAGANAPSAGFPRGYSGDVAGWPTYGQGGAPTATAQPTEQPKPVNYEPGDTGVPSDSPDKPAPQDPAPSPAPAKKPPTQGAPAATQPPSTPQTGAAGQGGGPGAGGIGNLFRDIMGIMSGNPMALGALVQDLARMGGQQGVGGQPGQPGMQPWMLPNQAGMHTMPGDPSTFGGPQYAGMTPSDGPPPRRRPPQAPAAARGAPGARPAPRQPPGDPNVPGAASGPQPAPYEPGGSNVGADLREAAAQQPGTGGTRAAPSRKADGTMPSGRAAVAPLVSDTLRQAGLPDTAIQGILYNVGRESSFNPSQLTRADQANHPEFRGTEANNAHGLYQEGGDEWNNYSRWLAGRDWRDPKLQTQFLAANIKARYPQLWNKLRNASSPEQAAADFAKDYLKPAKPYLIQRLNDIRRGGVQQAMRGGGNRQGLVGPATGRQPASPAEQMANEAYAQRMGRGFNARNPDWRRSPNIEDRRTEDPSADLGRSWPTSEPWSRAMAHGPRINYEPYHADPDSPLARDLGIDEIRLRTLIGAGS